MNVRLIALMFALLIQPAAAERLDDSLSTQQQFDLDLDWKHKGNAARLSERELNALTAKANYVEVRLNTALYVGRQARIFLSLPVDIRGSGDATALRMSWETNGLFSSGAINAGNRTKIFQGDITESVMTEVFRFTFDIDARQVYNTLRFQPVFEIETF